MSDSQSTHIRERSDFEMSVNGHFVKFINLWMEINVDFLHKLQLRIAAESDPVKLKELRNELTVLLAGSEQEILIWKKTFDILSEKVRGHHP